MADQQEDKALKFKAVTEGLGFHPFATGLPYSPQNPQSTTQRPLAHKPLQTLSVTQASLIQQPIKATVTAPPSPASSTVALDPFDYDYVLSRFFAYALDTLFNFFIASIVIFFCMWLAAIPLNTALEGQSLTHFLFLMAIISWALVAAQEVVFGTSLGKIFYRLRLQADKKVIIQRSLYFLLSVLSLGIGLLICLFDPKKQCLHDRLSQLQPKEVNELD